MTLHVPLCGCGEGIGFTLLDPWLLASWVLTIVSLQQVAVILTSSVELTSHGCWATAGGCCWFFSWWKCYSLPRVFLLAGFNYLHSVAGVLQTHLAFIIDSKQVASMWFITKFYLFSVMIFLFNSESLFAKAICCRTLLRKNVYALETLHLINIMHLCNKVLQKWLIVSAKCFTFSCIYS